VYPNTFKKVISVFKLSKSPDVIGRSKVG